MTALGPTRGTELEAATAAATSGRYFRRWRTVIERAEPQSRSNLGHAGWSVDALRRHIGEIDAPDRGVLLTAARTALGRESLRPQVHDPAKQCVMPLQTLPHVVERVVRLPPSDRSRDPPPTLPRTGIPQQNLNLRRQRGPAKRLEEALPRGSLKLEAAL